MLIIPTPNPALLIAKRFSFAYINGSAASSGTNQATYTFSNVPFGSPAATRTIIVAVAGRANTNRSISSVTVGGVTATEITQSSNTSGGGSITGIYRADVPAGASGSVVVTFSGQMVRAGIAAYRMEAGAAGAHAFTALNTSTAGTIDVPAGGAALAVAFTNAVATATWSGLTENTDMQIESASSFSTASGTFESAQSGLSVSASWSSSNAVTACIASFAPA